MVRRLGPRTDGGAGLAEYAGLVVLAALILGALVAIGIPSKVETGVSSAICRIFQGQHCGKPEASGSPPGDQSPGAQSPGSQPTNVGPTNGNQNPNGQKPNGNQPSLSDLQKNADKAQKAANDTSGKYGNIKQQIIDLLKDFIGITDIEDCITKGSISSCLWAAFDVASWVFAALKIAKFAKAVKDAIKLWKVFNKGRKIIDRAREAAKAAKTRYGKALARLKHGCPANSFTGDTSVVLGNGRTRLIRDVRPGDAVLAGDPRTGRNTAVIVRGLIVGTGQKTMVRLKVAGDPYSLTLGMVNATANHPFWAPAGHRWMDASSLRPNDRLATSDGVGLRVLAQARYATPTTVFNLSVDAPHTYYIRAGASNVLVHNTPPEGCLLTGNGPKIFSKTISTAKNRSWRVDIENPEPGKPSANMHLQLMGRGAKAADKYFYNPTTGEWLTEAGQKLPKSIAKQVPQSVINKGLQQLGVP